MSINIQIQREVIQKNIIIIYYIIIWRALEVAIIN